MGWAKGAPSPPLMQYLERHKVSGRAMVPSCGHGHEMALAVSHGIDAIGLDIGNLRGSCTIYPGRTVGGVFRLR